MPAFVLIVKFSSASQAALQPELETLTLSLGLHYSHLVVAGELPLCL